MKSLTVILTTLVACAATAQESQQNPKIPPKCEAYLNEQLRQGGELLRVLGAPAAPDFTKEEWAECQQSVLSRIGTYDWAEHTRRKVKLAIEQLERYKEESRREQAEKKAACEAQPDMKWQKYGRGNWHCKEDPAVTRAKNDARQKKLAEEYERKQARKREATNRVLRNMCKKNPGYTWQERRGEGYTYGTCVPPGRSK